MSNALSDPNPVRHDTEYISAAEKDMSSEHVEESRPEKKLSGEKIDDDDDEFPFKEQRKIVHKVDRRLIAMLGFLHTVSLLDRANLSSAAVSGMNGELNLHGTQYSSLAVAFFPPYICCQVLGPVLVRKLGAIPYLSGICFLWGAVIMCGGFVNNFSELVGIRVIVGALEAGFFPASVYLISTWYTRYELHKRYAVFHLLGCVAAAVGGILAYGITFMGGLGGLTSWRWIFVIEGLITCLLAFISYFVLVDFPDRMKMSRRKFMSGDQYDFVIRRITKDRADVEVEPFSMGKYLRAGLDLNIWIFGFIYFTSTTPAYALGFFMTLIFKNLFGFSTAAALCLHAPPYVAAGIGMMITSWIGDKYHVRGPILVFNATLCIIGLPLMAYTSNTGSRLFGSFLTAIGSNGNIPAAMAYQANNVRGQWTRAICSSIFVALGASGGMTGSLVFRSQDAPQYLPGFNTCIGLSVLTIFLVGILSVRFYLANRKVDRGELVIAGLPGFKYTY